MSAHAENLQSSTSDRFRALTAALDGEGWRVLGVLASELRVAPSTLQGFAPPGAREKLGRWLVAGVADGLLIEAGTVRSLVTPTRTEQALTIAPEYRALTLRALAHTNELDAVRAAARSVVSDRSVSGFVTALFGGDVATLERATRDLKFRFASGEDAPFARTMLWQALCSPFDGAWLDQTWGANATLLTQQALDDALLTLTPVNPLYDYALERAHSAQGESGGIVRVLAEHAFLRGDGDALQALTSSFPMAERLAWSAAQSLWAGDRARAQGLLDESVAWRDRKTSAPRHPPALTAVLSLIALSRDPVAGATLAKRFAQSKAAAAALPGWTAAPRAAAVGRVIRRVIQLGQQREAERPRLDVHQLPAQTAAWESLLLGLAVSLYQNDRISRAAWALRLASLATVWREAGYLWMSDQAAAVARALEESPDDSGARRPASPSQAAALLPELIRPLPQWRQSLAALAAFAKSVEPAVQGARRVAWFVDLASGQLAKPAVEEFVSGTGWTHGRRVPVEDLLAIQETLPPEDARVLAFVERIDEGYAFTPEALEALIGHPRVYNGARGRLTVEVARGTCRVETRSEDGELVIHVEPPRASRGINVVVENESRIVVYRVSEAVEKLTSLLGNRLRIPQAHAREALPVLARLAEHVEVHSPHLATERTTTADSTPCLRISADAGAFWVEPGVRPFGASGRFFPPGVGASSVTLHDGAELLRAERDFDQELARCQALIRACPSLLEALDRERAESGSAEPYQSTSFSEEGLLSLLTEVRDSGVRCEIEWQNSRPIGFRGTVTGRALRGALRRTKGWYIVTGGVRIDEVTELALAELVRMPFTKSGRFVRLPTGDFLEVEERLRRALAGLKSAATSAGPRGELRVPDAAFALGAVLSGETGMEVDASVPEWAALVHEVSQTEYALPDGLAATLRPYQADGYQWLRRASALGLGVILADDMGLGKTLQVLALLLERERGGPALVVAPTSVCANWIDEIARFVPRLRAVEYTGKSRGDVIARCRGERGDGTEERRFDVVVTSYALLQQNADELASVEWHTAVLDEAQFIKNAASQRARAAFRLAARYRVALTGTPIENQLGDLWSIFHFLNPPLLGSAKHFELRYIKPIERDGDVEQRAALKSLIQPFILRRTKDAVLKELPPVTSLRHEVRLTEQEAMRYAVLRRQIHEKLHTPHGKRDHKLQVFAEITRLRRFCCHPRLVFPDAPLECSKLEAFLELVEELREGGHRALVFSQFVDYLDIVREHLDERRIRYVYLDGSTPRELRRERVAAFQAGECELFLISLKAGGFGLNLTAADYVIHLDPWWNPAVEAQATDRAHRIGQDRPVTVYRLITKDTIEERIVDLHRTKRALADAVLEGADVASKLSLDDLYGLLDVRA